MWFSRLAVVLFLTGAAAAEHEGDLAELSRRYLADLIRLDTTNPPGNETRVAQYLKQVCDSQGISSELLGADPARLNFVARIPGSGGKQPLLLMAHSDVVPAERSQWTVDPFSGLIREGFIYGRGAQDDKSLLAAELAVFVELKRRGVHLDRDVILLSEADEEAGSTGIQWLIANAWEKITAEFALNEGGFAISTGTGRRIYEVQTSEKIPTRIVLLARGKAGHGSLPREDNPVVHLAQAIVRLTNADQPVRLNTTTERYLHEIAKLPDYRWLVPLIPKLENPRTAMAAAHQIRARDTELDAMLRTTVSPTMLRAGGKINVIPNSAEAQIDVRRLPNETRDEVVARLRHIVRDSAVEVQPAPGQEMPATEPSGITTPLYRVMQQVFAKSSSGALVIPYMVRGATDGSFLRQKGIDVYGVPIFLREDKESRAHGNDERISVQSLGSGARLLMDIVLAASQ
ncbi:MAG TPA: M20/M25/M40 family metallo-hydrolase [Bryobacteraceae bacterium]|nr:M20/M25/M40 family metallo-hydrolase [Bryobacteraceae bacterium]